MTKRQPSDKAWVSAKHMLYFLALGEAAGLPLDDLLKEAGIDRARLTQADAQVQVTALELLLKRLSERVATPLIGLQLAGEVQPATFGVLGFITQACASFGDVLDLLERYNGLLSNIGHTSLHYTPGEVRVRWDCNAGGPLFKQHASDYVLGSFTVLGRALLPGNNRLPLYINLAHPPPARAAWLLHYHALFRCPVYFNKPYSEVVLPYALRHTPLQHGDALVREALEGHAQQLLARRSRTNLVADTRELIAAMLTDTSPGKEVVAEQLGMSGRTLHRALQRLGTSYQVLLDEVRFSRAERLLGDSRQAVEAVALQVGFQSRQSFIRWFRRIKGCTPGEYRQSHTDSSAS